MRRTQGTWGVALEECIDPNKNIWHMRADVQPYYDEEGVRQGVDYWEEEIDHQPTDEDWESFNATVANTGE